MANVLKVFLENGQTKSFKYDSTTTVQNVVTSLRDKLCLTAGEHFSLVVEHVKSLKRNKLTLLDPQETVARIAARPGAHKLRCLFRVTFVPVSAAALAQKDLNALDYLFLQCCNDVTQERFAPELQPEVALRLAALHMHQHALANNISPAKLTVKTVEREFGLDRFVPASLIEGMKRKELRRLLGHFLKLNSQMTGSSTKMLTQLQAKIHYLDIISGLPSYGAKCFSTNQRDGVERVLLVSPRFGLSQIAGVRNTVPQPICNLEELIRVVVTRDDDVSNTVTVFISPDRVINFAMEDRDASEFAIVLAGYYRLMAGKELPLEQERDMQIEDIAPPYLSQHTVVSNGWSYLPSEKPTHSIAFLMPPPYHSTGFRSATGSISSSSRSDECDRNANSARMSNKNARPSLQEYDFEANGKLSKDGGSIASAAGAKIGGVPMAVSEARNEEVLRRVAEMQKMVESSERYLNEHGDYGHEFDVKPGGKLNFWRETSVDVDESDCESLNSSKQSSNEDGPGVLKHSDSLTLLTETINQGLDGIAKGLNSIYTAPFSEMNGKLETGSAQNTPKSQRKVSGLSQILSDLQALGNDLSQSESDSESLYTPNSSPIHKTNLSLAQQQQQQHQLASPHHPQATNSATNLRNKTIRTSFGLHSPDSGGEGRDMSLKDYLRQLKEASSASELGTDGTDLAAKKLADLYGYELLGDESIIETDPDIIDLRSIPPPQTPDELDNLNVLSVPPTGFDDGTGANKVAANGTNGATNTTTAAGSGAGTAGDLEEFLKQVTIEPPTQKITPAVELTPEEILSYIIPPPPGLGDRGDAGTHPPTSGPESHNSTIARRPVPNHAVGAKASVAVSTNNNINTLKNLNYETVDSPVPRPRMATLNGTNGTPATVANGAIGSALLAKYAYDPTRFEVYYPPQEADGRGPTGTTEYDLYSNSAAATGTAAAIPTKQPNGTQEPKNGVANGAPNGHVIEYPTVDRKGPFSCCAKSKSKDKQNGPETEPDQEPPPLALPPKPCPHTASSTGQPSPPQRPPKSAELQLRLGSPVRSPPAASYGHYAHHPALRTNGNYYELGPDPPSLPPRFEQSPPPVPPIVTTLPPKKPPLPPVPLKPCMLRSPVPILKNAHAAPGVLLHQFHHQLHQSPPVPPLPHHLHHHHHLQQQQHQQHPGAGVSLSANSSPVRTAGIGSPHLHRNPNCYREIERAFNHHRPDPDSPEKANAAGHQRSHSDCPPVCLKNPPADSRAQLTLLCSPQLSRKTSLPTAISPALVGGPNATAAVTFSNPGSPILANKNGHVLNVDTLMAKTDVAMAGLLVKLDQVAAACSAAQTAGGGTAIDEDRFQQARDELTDQALQLVTASKHLVVSMSDANLTHLPEHLTACLSALRRITELAQDLTRTTSAPLQTRNIVLKIHDVASSFRELACVKVGPGGAGQLALNAECLANVLATLLRRLLTVRESIKSHDPRYPPKIVAIWEEANSGRYICMPEKMSTADTDASTSETVVETAEMEQMATIFFTEIDKMFGKLSEVLQSAADVLAPPPTALQDFDYHYRLVKNFYIADKTVPKIHINDTNIPTHLDQMLQILIREEQRLLELDTTHADLDASSSSSEMPPKATQPPPPPSPLAKAECMEFVLSNRPLDVLIEFAVNDTPPGARNIVLNWVRRFLSCLKCPPLGHASIFQPVQRLVEICSGTYASPYEREEILFLETVAGLVRKDSILVNLFLKSHHHSAQMLANWKGLGVNKAPVNNPLFVSTKIEYDSRRISLVTEDSGGGGGASEEAVSCSERKASCAGSGASEDPECCDCDEEDHFILFDAIVSYLDSADSTIVVRACEGVLILASLPTLRQSCKAIRNTISRFATMMAARLASNCQQIPEDMDTGDIEDATVTWGLFPRDPEQPHYIGRYQLTAFLCWLDYCDCLLKECALLVPELGPRVRDEMLISYIEPALVGCYAPFMLVLTAKIIKKTQSKALLDEIANWLIGEDDLMDVNNCLLTILIENAHENSDILLPTLQFVESLLDNPHEKILHGLLFFYINNRGYYDSSSQTIQSWSDEEDNRVRRRGSAEDPIKSRTLAPSNILRVINQYDANRHYQTWIKKTHGFCWPIEAIWPNSGESSPLAGCSVEPPLLPGSTAAGLMTVVPLAPPPKQPKKQRGGKHGTDSGQTAANVDLQTCGDSGISEESFYEGPLLKLLFSHVKQMNTQPYELNLAVIAILSKLALFPHPYLHEILLNPEIPVAAGATTLWSVMQFLARQLLSEIPRVEGFQEKIKDTGRRLLSNPPLYHKDCEGAEVAPGAGTTTGPGITYGGEEEDEINDPLFESIVVLEEFCKELAAIAFVKYHHAKE
uniref:FERM domain-containing protein n=1 Tax=Anopheles dirus TaxID=7168 RepID=A0A182N6Q9_9DIPT